MAFSDKTKQTCVKRNIHWSFKAYKMTFIYALDFRSDKLQYYWDSYKSTFKKWADAMSEHDKACMDIQWKCPHTVLFL